jgi:hypothetical protein
VDLSPRTAERVDSEWRGQVADYMLGQQSGPESTATKGHLKRSESARSWAFSILDSLDNLYGDGERPLVPDASEDGDSKRRGRDREAAAAPAAAAPPRESKREKDEDRKKDRPRTSALGPARNGGPLSPAARTALRRRRIFGGLATLLVVGAVVAALLLLTGGDDDKKTSTQANTTQTTGGQARVVGQLPLKGLGQFAKTAEGIAVVAQRGNTPQLIMQAQLPPSQRRQAYEVWLYNSPTDAVSLGASTANKQGQFQGQGQLPANWRRFKFVDVSLETIDSNLKHSGNSVLRGAIADLQAPPAGGTGTTPGGASTTPTTPAP